jgi:hypothetical protein
VRELAKQELQDWLKKNLLTLIKVCLLLEKLSLDWQMQAEQKIKMHNLTFLTEIQNLHACLSNL